MGDLWRCSSGTPAAWTEGAVSQDEIVLTRARRLDRWLYWDTWGNFPVWTFHMSPSLPALRCVSDGRFRSL